MRLRMSLSQKVLILLALPLIVQWIFLAWLMKLQEESEHAVERTVHAKDLVDAINRLRGDMLYNGISLAGADRLPVPADEANARAQGIAIQHDFAALKAMTTNDDPRLRQAILNSEKEMQMAMNGLIEIRESVQRYPLAYEERRALWSTTRKHLYYVLKNDFSKFGEEQANLARRSPSIQGYYRKMQLQIMGALALITLFLTIALSIFLTRGIFSRIGRVSDNAYRLASDRPLQDVLQGSDEIAKLDQTFHLMAEALKDAENLKQEMVVMVTHDLRTPLTTVQNILKFLRRGNFGQLDEKGTEYIKVADRNVQRMANLVNDLLDTETVKSGILALDQQTFELASCFTAAAELAGAFAEEAGTKIEIRPTNLQVEADHDQIVRVLANLIGNAAKFSPAGSTVTVGASLDRGAVCITVEDEGPGIPVNQLQDIFERFHQIGGTTNKDKVGSGLGLHICQAIVHLHGGKIWAENLPERGSRFTFTLKPGR